MIQSICLVLLVLFNMSLPSYPPEGQTLVIFGATGDLTQRKLMPALVNLEREGHLKNVSIVGVGRKALSQEEFLTHVGSYVKDRPTWAKLQKKITYLAGPSEGAEIYQALAQRIHGQALFYLAVPPSQFAPLVDKLSSARLTDRAHIVVEKPFGVDLSSALALQEDLDRHVTEEQIYRIDHYLGKSALVELMNFRFQDGSFEERWNRGAIQKVEITISEDIGVGSRGSYWEETGLLRDMIQNHALQMLALTAMDKPSDLTPEQIRQEKIRVVEAICPLAAENAIRGQYEGYREEKDVAKDSSIETFAQVTLFIDTPRWQGVPFVIKAGKKLAERKAEIAVTFPGERLVIEIQPKEEIYVVKDGQNRVLLSKEAGRDAYETLLLQALSGNASYFVSSDELLASWRLFTPLLHDWASHPALDFPNYSPGSFGPPG